MPFFFFVRWLSPRLSANLTVLLVERELVMCFIVDEDGQEFGWYLGQKRSKEKLPHKTHRRGTPVTSLLVTPADEFPVV
jgi:hypothetical protein